MYEQYSDSDDDRSQSLISASSSAKVAHSTTIEEEDKRKIVTSKSPKRLVDAKDTPLETSKDTVGEREAEHVKMADDGRSTEKMRTKADEAKAVNQNLAGSDQTQRSSKIANNGKSSSAPTEIHSMQQRAVLKVIKGALSAEQRHHQLVQERFDHYSYTCHLFPRLSQSNLQFHDIYWNKEPETGAFILRRRHVCVNKLVKSLSIRFTERQRQPQNILQQRHFRANLSLLDRRPFAKRQIVSNICSVSIPTVEGSVVTRVFRKNPLPITLLVRSNYRNREVALQIVLESIVATTSTIIGRVELDLVDGQYKMAIANRTHSHTFEEGICFEFETADVPQRVQLETDSLPDVLICDERWISMLAVYRQLMCQQLAENGNLFADRTAWIIDPVMATFTTILDNNKNATDLLLKLMDKYEVFNKELKPYEAVRRFHFVYMQFVLPLLAMEDSANWQEQLKAFVNGQSNEEPNAIAALTIGPCKKLDIYEYALNLCGNHSID